MTKLAYLECPTGLAGDMCLGALVDAGVPLEYLIERLKPLGMAEEYHLWAEQVHRNGQRATKIHVDLLALNSAAPMGHQETGVDPHTTFDHAHPDMAHPGGQSPGKHHHSDPHPHQHESGTRHLPEIEQLITSAGLPPRVEAWSLAVFRQLAEAEGAVHGISPNQVHFHEVGATDAIVDIVGTCLGLDWLGIEELYCSALPTGGGTIRAAHGQLPVPSPAVLKLWEMRQVPIYHNGIERELVTPTGAAIATTLAVQFGPPPPMTLQRVGLGAGARQLPLPNMVRLWIGEISGQPKASAIASDRLSDRAAAPQMDPARLVQPLDAQPTSPLDETIAVLETQIDDLNPQAIGYVFEALFKVGALDVFTQAVGMKKSRPGILLTVICYPRYILACEDVLFKETTTLGIRRVMQQRKILHRDIVSVQTPFGEIRVKVARFQPSGSVINIQPEYEDCATLARRHQQPWQEVHQAAMNAWSCLAKTSQPVEIENGS